MFCPAQLIKPHLRAALAVDNAEAVVLNLVQPLAAGGSRVRNVAAALPARRHLSKRRQPFSAAPIASLFLRARPASTVTQG
jgi:hypothetical protein